MKRDFNIDEVKEGDILRDEINQVSYTVHSDTNGELCLYDDSQEDAFWLTPLTELDLSSYILFSSLEDEMDYYLDKVETANGWVDTADCLEDEIKDYGYQFSGGMLVAYALSKGWHIQSVEIDTLWADKTNFYKYCLCAPSYNK